MSKRGYISRYLLIIKKVKAKRYISFEELVQYVESNMDVLRMTDDDLKVSFSKRTLQRDLKDIRNAFGIDIEYSRAQKGYFVLQDQIENVNFQRTMEAYDLFNTINLSDDVKAFIQFETRRPQGIENFNGILHAIKNRLRLSFTYFKYWEHSPSMRVVEPYTLKEFKNRWYIFAKDDKDQGVKTFALDRISDFVITEERFRHPIENDIETRYQYCFGIISPEEEKPQEVLLSFSPYQGKYVKSLPLHATQEVVLDNEKECRVKLNIFVTYDFKMELLSLGENVKVLKPTSLAKAVKLAHQNSFKQYE